MAGQQALPQLTGEEYVTFILNQDFDLFFAANSTVFWLAVIVLLIGLFGRLLGTRLGVGSWRRFEIDQAQFGLGSQKIILRPNNTDRQIAYKIWVELSTRKIGLPISLEDDVISEIYDSWYTFFSVARNLIKDVPVSKFRRRGTEQIIILSIEVLNSGIRPNLTKWQARFRRWNARALEAQENSELSPQEIQKKFPEYPALIADIKDVNQRLIKYREKMYELVTGV